MLFGSRYEPGTVIRFTYVDANNVMDHKEVMVLNYGWNGQLHAIDTKRLTDAERHVLSTVIDPREKDKRHGIPLIDDVLRRMDPSTLIDNPLAFYYQFVKPFLRNRDAYRIYSIHSMSSITISKKRPTTSTPTDDGDDGSREQGAGAQHGKPLFGDKTKQQDVPSERSTTTKKTTGTIKTTGTKPTRPTTKRKIRRK